MQQAGNGFWVWHWIFEFSNSICHVGVCVCHASKAHMVDASIMSKAHFFDDVLRCSPNGNPLFGFNAKLAPSLVTYASLVHFHFVCRGPGLFSLPRSGWSVTALLDAPACAHSVHCSAVRRWCDHAPCVKVSMERCICVLKRQEQIRSKRGPTLLLPSTNRPTTEQGWCC